MKNDTEMIEPPKNREPRAWSGEIPLTSFYTAGAGGQIFLHALKTQGKLIGTRCSPCEQVYLPARSFCERCFAELVEQVEVKRTGKLVSYTFCHVDHNGARLRRPVALALIQLEGATTLLLHRLLGVSDPGEVKIGSRVETVIKPKAKRHGTILDIEGFRILQ
ncbi:MAG: Zn-ribbon domain-containing OB-fold protein [Deltaproteobacteria bacterium]|nr:Zn-ribbon domain-containing OB-fold protein [Deltaproteobacteria bacterium]MBI2231417.1 Zn-ribbon domain-containing OB-fold protein [Deltaproteobacteria bacterium]